VAYGGAALTHVDIVNRILMLMPLLLSFGKVPPFVDPGQLCSGNKLAD